MTEVLDWMKDSGAKIPSTHGFLCLNSLRATMPCASLDHQPRELGARAAELVIGHVIHNEYGPPTMPSLTSIPARWVEGPTVRLMEDAAASPATAPSPRRRAAVAR
jgi:LacI family transcriptional regulator